MNFLAHYYCLAEKEDEHLVLGNLLPDIVPHFSKIYNQKIKPKSLKEIGGVDLSIEQGIYAHLKTDGIFHEHELFHLLCGEAKSVIKSKSIDTNRKNFVIAHVLVELLLDRFLIEKNESLVIQFYEKLDEVAIPFLSQYVKKRVGIEDDYLIISKFKSFLSGNYAQALFSDRGIAFALSQILGARIGSELFENQLLWQEIVSEVYKIQKDKSALLVGDIKIEMSK